MNLRKQKKKQILFMIYWSGYDQHHRKRQHTYSRALERSTPLSTSLRTFTKPSIHPYRLWSTDSDNVHCTPIVTNVSEAPTVPRQEHPQIYWQQSGDLDITYRETLQSGSMYGEKILPYYLEKPSPDIDMPSDLQSFQ